MSELQPDPDRQATAAIRGYGYQCYQTIKAWLSCSPEEKILCEFAEDIDVIRRDLNGVVSEAELNQVKHQKQNITLNSPQAIEAINNFFRHKQANPILKFQLRLWTISDRGSEKNIDWKYSTNGMNLWELLRDRSLHGSEQREAIETLRRTLAANQSLSQDAKLFLASNGEASFLSELIDNIFWDTNQPSYVQIQAEIRQLLASRERPITDPIEVAQALDRLFRYVVDRISTSEDRSLDHRALQGILSEITCARIDRETLRQVSSDVAMTRGEIQTTRTLLQQLSTQALRPHDASGIGTNRLIEVQNERVIIQASYPPLPSICSPRHTVSQSLHASLRSGGVTWIHGSTGYGKTTLANLAIRVFAQPFLWCRLSYAVDIELASCFRLIVDQLSTAAATPKVLVLDDVRISEANVMSVELMAELVNAINKIGIVVIVTSQFRIPSRFSALTDGTVREFDVPQMSEIEIGDLLRMAGLQDPSLLQAWSSIIHVKTHGHPQLVGAYVTYAKGIEWVISNDALFVSPAATAEIRKESRSQLAATMHSPEARELARRLSIVYIDFPREFAISVANVAPCLKEPGRAFDSLLGPWIEQISDTTFCLSPLLHGYAESELGRDGLKEVNRIVAHGWYRQNQLTPAQFIQLLTCALASKQQLLVGQAAFYILTMKGEILQGLAKALWLICHVGLETSFDWSGIDHRSRYIFRRAQLRVAKYGQDRNLYVQIDGLSLTELRGITDEQESRNYLFWHYAETCIEQNSALPQQERTDRAIKAVKMFQQGLVSDLFETSSDPKSHIYSALLLATATLERLEDLEHLFRELDRQESDLVSEVLATFRETPELLSLLLDRVWLAQSKMTQPAWDSCLRAFSKIAEFAISHDDVLLFDVAIRAKMIVSDEYMGDPAAALGYASEARTRHRGRHVLIDLAESTVCYRKNDYQSTMQLIDGVEAQVQGNDYLLERLFTLRRGIISASRQGSWAKISWYATRGIQIAESSVDSLLMRATKIAFLAEQAWVSHERDDRLSAIQHFENVVELLKSYPNQSFPLFNILRLRVGHTLSWLAGFLRLTNNPETEGAQSQTRPFSGMFANLEDPPQETLKMPGGPYEGYYSFLAKYGAWHLPAARLRSLTDRGLAITSRGQWFLSAWVSWEARLSNALAQRDYTSAITCGVTYVAVEISTAAMREAGGLERAEDAYGTYDDPLRLLSGSARVRAAEVIPTRVIEPVLMVICSASPQVEVDTTSWEEFLVNTFGHTELIEDALHWVKIGLKALGGDVEAIRTTRKAVWDQRTPTSHRLAHIVCCASDQFLPIENLSLQASFLLQIAYPLTETTYAESFTRMVAKRWVRLATEQRFLITSPNLHAPLILEACSPSVPTVQECARLLLLVGDAIQATWPGGMREKLASISQ